MNELQMYVLYGISCVMFGYVAIKFFYYTRTLHINLKNGKFLYDPNNAPSNKKEFQNCIYFTRRVRNEYFIIGMILLCIPSMAFMSILNPFITMVCSACIGESLFIIVTMIEKIIKSFSKKYCVAIADIPSKNKKVDLS